MPTYLQNTANKANAQHSTGPKTESGKAASSQNNRSHGLTGQFTFLPTEDPTLFESLLEDLRAQHQPATAVESLLIDRMAEHYWLAQRALTYQNNCFAAPEFDAKQLAVFLRYQTTHDRAFYKCLAELAKLRAETRKQEIGFESQKMKEAAEYRKQERHEALIRARYPFYKFEGVDLTRNFPSSAKVWNEIFPPAAPIGPKKAA